MTSPRAAGASWHRAATALSPRAQLVSALEITHPDVPAPARAVNDTESRTIEGNVYPALRFEARLADDIEGQAPRAELSIDNVGHVLTQWVELSNGGAGAKVRVMEVRIDPPDDPVVEWELTLTVESMHVRRDRVAARIGFSSLRGRAAVIARHDPSRSPGLF